MGAPNTTPGPWRVVSEREDELKVKGPSDEWVADCADGFWSDESDGWIMAVESQPNANQIAASPELFDALAAVMPYLEEGDLPDEDDNEPVGWYADNDGSNQRPLALTFGMIRRARAALAKARGVQP